MFFVLLFSGCGLAVSGSGWFFWGFHVCYLAPNKNDSSPNNIMFLITSFSGASPTIGVM
jgi:hypothetical protein